MTESNAAQTCNLNSHCFQLLEVNAAEAILTAGGKEKRVISQRCNQRN